MMSREACTYSAMSILLMINRSDLVMPGPPLRGILSPADTSITYRVRSDSSGLKVADRLSPPDSTSTSSRFGCRFCRSSMAAKFMEASSRMAVWGQPPVSTPSMRSAGRALCFSRKSASSLV